MAADDNATRFISELEDAFFFFDRALVKSGRRNPAWGTTSFELIDLPDAQNPGEWSLKYSDKIEQALIEDKRYIQICKEIAALESVAKRNRYSLEVYGELNELQHFPVSLILALADFDKADDNEKRTSALLKIESLCDSFKDLRTSLEDVYSKVRFLDQPEGYIPEMNHHNHLSLKSLNFDWMYYYEIPMIDAIMRWMK